MTAEIGRVLGGRYRLVAPIGMGASAQVYLADDVKLRRRVALKMLHEALAGDADFTRRFRAEARAAAALSHPNVMAVYDWGDGDVAFIVTEYLSGGSLRALLDGGNLLSPAQALGVGLEAARALDYAHRRGFVHRDIKPANLLFGEEQRLRIADFGLARALAEAAWTEPQGAVLGTARYASPEQAKGEKLTGKADVYSLALVLVEAVSGEVPFVADTTLGTLMARVDKPLVVPDSLGPLHEVIAQAGHPDPAQRIDARTLAAGLLRAAKVLSRPAPLPLAGALSPLGREAIDDDPTIHRPGPPLDEGATAATPSDLRPDDLELGPPSWVNQAALGLAAGAGAGGAGDRPVDGPADEPADEPHAGDGAVASPTGSTTPEGPPPDPGDGPDRPDVEAPSPPAKAGGAGAEGHQDGDEPSPPVDLTEGAGTLAAGAAGTADELDLTDAATAAPTWADAPSADPEPVDRVVAPGLARAGSSPGSPVSPTPAPATSQTAVVAPPAAVAGSAGRDDTDRRSPGHPDRRRRWPWIVLVVVVLVGGGGAAAALVANRDQPAPALAPLTLPVPALTGLTPAQVQDVAQAAGWKVSFVHTRRDGTKAHQVLASKPAPGTRLATGSTVAVTVSDGQTLVAVPGDLVGKTSDAADAALGAVGLKAAVASSQYDEDHATSTVLAVAPGTPAKLEKGSTVGLVVSKGPRPRTVPGGLRGSTLAEATAALHAVQLQVATTSAYSDTVAKGKIIAVVPGEGASVPRGSVVTVELSKGPELVAVPSIKGASTLSQAIAILEGKGFVAGNVSGRADGTPKRTKPAAGTMVPKGTAIDIVLG